MNNDTNISFTLHGESGCLAVSGSGPLVTPYMAKAETVWAARFEDGFLAWLRADGIDVIVQGPAAIATFISVFLAGGSGPSKSDPPTPNGNDCHITFTSETGTSQHELPYATHVKDVSAQADDQGFTVEFGNSNNLSVKLYGSPDLAHFLARRFAADPLES